MSLESHRIEAGHKDRYFKASQQMRKQKQLKTKTFQWDFRCCMQKGDLTRDTGKESMN